MTRRLITEATVRAAAREGRPVTMAATDLVTPAARDLARALGVALPAAADPPTLPSGAPSVVVMGADHGGYRLKEALKPVVTALGFRVTDVGCGGTEPVDYPVFAGRVADAVALADARFGVMIDGAGIGSAMVANKVPGVRAAPCHDRTTAENARAHNDANVLTLGGGLIGERLAADIVTTFLTTPFGGGRHERRVAMIRALDQGPN